MRREVNKEIMGLQLQFFVVFALCACSIPAIYAKPRDSSVFKIQNVVRPDDDSAVTEVVKAYTPQDVRIPGRVHCEAEEPQEDPVCQEHCLPKGYTYGICVSETCSCI